MKTCTWCGKEYPDEAAVCSLDQQPLAPSVLSPAEGTETQPINRWPSRVLLPAVLWLISSWMLGGLFSVAATFLFGLGTALWAAIDCSKLQSRGWRVLGMQFKPIIVFGVCAYLFWGFGFVWYLVMRHRIKSAPVDLEDEMEKVAA